MHAAYQNNVNQNRDHGFNMLNSPNNNNMHQHQNQAMQHQQHLNSSNYSNAGLSSNINNYQ